MDRAAPTCLDLLLAYRVPMTPQAALTYLTQQTARCGILNYYRLFFPQQWATSVTPLLPTSEHAYSPREWECFRLVDAQLFPLDLEWLLDLDEDPENRSPTLPISPIGLDWWDADSDAFRPGLQLLLVLSAALAPRDTDLPAALCAALEQAGAGQGAPLVPRPGRILPPPATTLLRAYEWIHHDTGITWLDASYENPIDLEWTGTDVEWCAAQYRAAEALLAEIAPLLDWLEADPAHPLEVLSLCSPHPPT
jgi:hypothetical protein